MKKFFAMLSVAILALAATVFAQSRQTYSGASVIAPIELTTSGPTANTTDDGVSYTSVVYIGELPNHDTYGVAMANYPFVVDAAISYPRMIADTAKALNATVLNETYISIASGQQAKSATFEFTEQGVTYRVFVVVTSKGNQGFSFMFLTDMNAPGTDMEAVKTFFTTIQLQ
jgi:hypothetical protein